MNRFIFATVALLLTACVHRFELSPQYESYTEKYEEVGNPRVRALGSITALEPDDSEKMTVEGTGYYLNLSGKAKEGYTTRLGLGYVPFKTKEYDATVDGASQTIELDTYSAAIEFALGYEIIDTSVLAVRPEIVVKEQLYYFDSGVGPSANSTIGHEFIGAALNLEFPFFIGSAIGIRGTYLHALEDNYEIKEANAFSATASLIFGRYSK